MNTLSREEPAIRLFNVALSMAEVVALCNWHVSIGKDLPKRMGKISVEKLDTKMPTAAQLKIIRDYVVGQMEAHADRAQALNEIRLNYLAATQTPKIPNPKPN